MLIRNADRDWNHRLGSEITPAAVYHARRDWMRQVAAGAAGLGLAAWAARDARAQMGTARPGKLPALPAVGSKVPGAVTVLTVIVASARRPPCSSRSGSLRFVAGSEVTSWSDHPSPFPSWGPGIQESIGLFTGPRRSTQAGLVAGAGGKQPGVGAALVL